MEVKPLSQSKNEANEIPEEKANEIPEEKANELPEEIEDIRYCKEHGAVTHPTIRSNRMFCPDCNKILAKDPYVTPTESVADDTEAILVPYEVEQKAEILTFIEERLKEIQGVGKAAPLIMRTLDDNPYPLRDRNTLHAFIKRMAPRVHDPHLQMHVIEPLFGKYPMLPNLIDQLIISSQQQAALQSGGYQQFYPPQQGLQMPPNYPFIPPHMRPQFGQYPPLPGYVPPQNPYPYGGGMYPPVPQWQAQSIMQKQVSQTNLVTVVINGTPVKMTPQEHMAFERWQEEKLALEEQRENRAIEREKLKAELIQITQKQSDDKVPVVIDGTTVQVPIALAPLYLKDDSKLIQAEQRLQDAQNKIIDLVIDSKNMQIKELVDRPSFAEQLQIMAQSAQVLGYSKGGTTTLDLISKVTENVDTSAKQLLDRLPPPGGIGDGEFNPEVSRTPAERKELAGTLIQQLEMSEEVLDAENEFILAVSKMAARKPPPQE